MKMINDELFTGAGDSEEPADAAFVLRVTTRIAHERRRRAALQWAATALIVVVLAALSPILIAAGDYLSAFPTTVGDSLQSLAPSHAWIVLTVAGVFLVAGRAAVWAAR